MKCFDDGLLVGMRHPLMSEGEPALSETQFKNGELRGCTRIGCDVCGKRVRHFDQLMLVERLSKEVLARAYAANDYTGLLATNTISEDYRTYLCACEVSSALGSTRLAEQRHDQLLYLHWYCRGH